MSLDWSYIYAKKAGKQKQKLKFDSGSLSVILD